MDPLSPKKKLHILQSEYSSVSKPLAMKLLEQSQVSPLPHESLPQSSSLPLTFLDIIWLDFHPVHRCFFYHFPNSTSRNFLDSNLPLLKTSLSLTLQHFYPLAGKARLSPASDQQFEIHYTKGDSVDFTVSETEDDFLDLVGSHPHSYTRLHCLVPELTESDAGKSLLAVQMTLFPNRGIAIGFAIHHVACDGFSSTHFIKSWAAACKSTAGFSVPRPSFDRTALADLLHECYLLVVNARKELKSQEPAEAEPDDSVSAIFRLGPDQIGRLKNWVRARADFVRASSFHCSTFVVSSAYLWACLVKLRRYPAGQTVYFPIAVDWRRRLRPPAPATYFGNCVCFSFVEMKAGEIVKDDGVMLASEAIGKAIEGLKDGIVRVVEESVEKTYKAFASNAVFTTAGSPRFGVYDADFGWGRPAKVEICMRNEGVFMAESREGSGGVEIGVVLPSWNVMEEFTTIFSEGLQLI